MDSLSIAHFTLPWLHYLLFFHCQCRVCLPPLLHHLRRSFSWHYSQLWLLSLWWWWSPSSSAVCSESPVTVKSPSLHHVFMGYLLFCSCPPSSNLSISPSPTAALLYPLSVLSACINQPVTHSFYPVLEVTGSYNLSSSTQKIVYSMQLIIIVLFIYRLSVHLHM